MKGQILVNARGEETLTNGVKSSWSALVKAVLGAASIDQPFS